MSSVRIRWRQFSLRTLLILMAVVAMLFASLPWISPHVLNSPMTERFMAACGYRPIFDLDLDRPFTQESFGLSIPQWSGPDPDHPLRIIGYEKRPGVSRR